MTDPKLLEIDMAAMMAAERARVAALDLPAAARALLDAARALAEHEADRLDIPFMDPTYHGCEPAWRALLYAAGDLRTVLRHDPQEEA